MADITPSGSGGPIRVSPPAPDGDLVVRGGVGGITAQLEELDLGAGKLDGLAERLGAVEGEVFNTWRDLGVHQNEPRSTGTPALIAVGEARDAVHRLATTLELEHNVDLSTKIVDRERFEKLRRSSMRFWRN